MVHQQGAHGVRGRFEAIEDVLVEKSRVPTRARAKRAQDRFATELRMKRGAAAPRRTQDGSRPAVERLLERNKAMGEQGTLFEKAYASKDLLRAGIKPKSYVKRDRQSETRLKTYEPGNRVPLVQRIPAHYVDRGVRPGMVEQFDALDKATRIGKAETSISHREAKRQVKAYGLTGTLPPTLDRGSRMKAYEGRYVVAGGPKGEKWHRRAKEAGTIKTTSLGVATAAAGTLLASRTKTGGKLARKVLKKPLSPTHARHAENSALGAATLGGAGELYQDVAQHKQARYRNSPAGVAASALTRMRAYPSTS